MKHNLFKNKKLLFLLLIFALQNINSFGKSNSDKNNFILKIYSGANLNHLAVPTSTPTVAMQLPPTVNSCYTVLTASGCLSTESVKWYKDNTLYSSTNPLIVAEAVPVNIKAGCSDGSFVGPLSAAKQTFPAIYTEILPNPITICSGGFKMLNATAITTGVNFQWQFNSNDIANANSSTYKATLPGQYRVITSKPSCAGEFISTNITANLNITPPPTLSISSTTASPVSIFAGESVTLNAIGCVGGSVLWSNNESSEEITVNPIENTTISFKCSISTCEYASDIFQINVAPIPIPSLSYSNLSDCNTVYLLANGCPANATIQWSDGQTGPLISVGRSINSIYTATCMIGSVSGSQSSTIVADAPIAFGNSAQQTIISGGCTTIYDQNCKIISRLCDPIGGPASVFVYDEPTIVVRSSTQYPTLLGGPYIQRYYRINLQNGGLGNPLDPDPQPITTSVTLFYTQKDFDDYNAYMANLIATSPLCSITCSPACPDNCVLKPLPRDPNDDIGKANLVIEKYSEGCLTGDGIPCAGSSNTTINPDDNKIEFVNGIWEVTFDVTSFSSFFLKAANNISNPLPVTLINFSVKSEENENLISWETTNEVNSASFEVQKSTDTKNFTTISKINANGNSTEPLIYSFLDKNINFEVNYYRLKQVDLDGKYSYSKVISVKNSLENKIKIYPNPVHELLQIENKEGKLIDIAIFDIFGKMVYKNSNLKDIQLKIPLNTVSKGIYFVQIGVDDKIVFKKIIKE